MKNLLLTALLVCGFLATYAQSPQKFSYQAVAVDATGNELKNTPLCIRASIIRNTFNGIQEWVEVHQGLTTDAFGLFTVEIGTGNPLGGSQSSFADVSWGSDKYFLKIEMSLNGQCTNYVLVGTNQLLAVPYALYADKAGKAVHAETATYADSSALAGKADVATLAINALKADSAKISVIALTALSSADDFDKNPLNEIQQLGLNGNTLSISGANSVTLNVNDADADPQNEIQQLGLSGKTLSLSGANSVTLDVNDADADPQNEIQQLALNGKTLSLSGSNSVTLDVSDADADPQNEIQNLTLTNSVLGLSKSNVSIDLNTLPGFNAAGSDFDFPQGIANVNFMFVPDTLTVPAGKNFYVIACEDEMYLPGVGNLFGRHWTGPNLPVFKPGTVIDECRCIGFYKPGDPFVDPRIEVLKPNQGNFYQVPFNKKFVVKSGLNETTPITLNGYTISPFGSFFKALVIPSGIQIRNISSNEVILTGYLLDN